MCGISYSQITLGVSFKEIIYLRGRRLIVVFIQADFTDEGKKAKN